MRARDIAAAATVLLLAACPGDDDWVTEAREQMYGDERDVDLDGNGKAEVQVLARAPDGQPREMAIDYDENGTIDAFLSYEADGWTYEGDLDHDGRPDRARRVHTDADGVITDVLAFDSDGDGMVDARQRTTLSPLTGVVETVVEIMALGEFWPIRTSTAALAGVFAQTSGGGPPVIGASCAGNELAIGKAFGEGVSEGRDCLGKISSQLATDFEIALTSRPSVEIICGDLSKAIDGKDPALAQATSIHTPSAPLGITVDPAQSGAVAPGVMFHEVMHYVREVNHALHKVRGDPLDPVYGCQDYCFGGQARQDCEKCMGGSQSAGGDCDHDDKDGRVPCSFDPLEKCLICNGMEFPASDPDSFCATCEGRTLVMRPGQTCCKGIVCEDGALCGVCGDQPFCSSFSSPRHCEQCPEGLRITSPTRRCCLPEETYNRGYNLCEQKCPGGSAAGGDEPYRAAIQLGTSVGRFEFTWENYEIPDEIALYHDGQVIFATDCAGGGSTVTIDYAGHDTEILVGVTPNCAGTTNTAWQFQVSCPQ